MTMMSATKNTHIGFLTSHWAFDKTPTSAELICLSPPLSPLAARCPALLPLAFLHAVHVLDRPSSHLPGFMPFVPWRWSHTDALSRGPAVSQRDRVRSVTEQFRSARRRRPGRARQGGGNRCACCRMHGSWVHGFEFARGAALRVPASRACHVSVLASRHVHAPEGHRARSRAEVEGAQDASKDMK